MPDGQRVPADQRFWLMIARVFESKPFKAKVVVWPARVIRVVIMVIAAIAIALLWLGVMLNVLH